MTTINEQEMKRQRGRPRKNRAVPTQVKQPKATASKTPELFVVMTSEWNKTFSKDSANTQPMEVDEHQQEHKIEGDNKHYQAAMQAFIKDNLSNGRTKMKFEFVIK